MPTLRLSRGPRQLSFGVHAYALAGHWVFAVALDSVARFAHLVAGGETSSR